MSQSISKPPQNKISTDQLLAPGLIIGEYQLDEKIGEGGMGEVWRATQPMIGKRVAVKILSPELAAQKKSVARFIQEARAVNEIHHQNLVDIFSFGELLDGRPYFVMEHLEGKLLADYMVEKGPLPFSEILSLMRQLCDALSAAHAKGIIHRDLKPENIFLIMRPGIPVQAKILDFGIAKLSKDGDSQNLTRTGSIFGTPGYMSPEQCEATKNVDSRSDVYALGIILYELITGANPFIRPGESVHMAIARQVSGPPPFPSQLVRNRLVPVSIDQFSRKALAYKQEERIQTCQEFYEQLKIAAGELAVEGWAELKNPRAATRPEDYYAGAKVRTLLPNKPPSKKTALIGALVSLTLGLIFTLIYVVVFIEKPEPIVVIAPAAAPIVQTVIAPELPTKPEKIKISVQSVPEGANVIWKDVVLGQTPLTVDINFEEKESALRVEKDGFVSWRQAITPNSAQNFSLNLATDGAAKPKKDKAKKDKDPDTDDTGNPFGN
jgi:serine/threonine protein kinase